MGHYEEQASAYRAILEDMETSKELGHVVPANIEEYARKRLSDYEELPKAMEEIMTRVMCDGKDIPEWKPTERGVWPENNGVADFGVLVDPLRDAVSAAYKLTRRGVKDIPYDGFDAPGHGLPIAEQLMADNLNYELHDQGRDAMRVILACAVQVGIEQGRRIAIKRLTFEADSARRLAEGLQRIVESEY